MPVAEISIVIPCYRSTEALKALVVRLLHVGEELGSVIQIILVDDASPDNTWHILVELKECFGDSLKIIRLLKNCGQHNALLCGMSHSSGSVVITMDDDLQNLPEDIPKLLAQISAGFDLAIGSYEIKQHNKLRNLGGSVIDCALRAIFDLPKCFQLTSFRAMNREVAANVCRMGGVFPYITAMLLSQSGNYVNVPVSHEPRQHGVSNYNISRSLSLAANLIFNYSSYPIYFIAILCLIAFAFAFAFGSYVLLKTIHDGSFVSGWPSTIVIISFLNAFVLLSLVIFGLYLTRISQQLNQSKHSFTIKEIL